ncbi:MAG: DUF6794 domain-containing protein [Saprospiraceae bacterium]
MKIIVLNICLIFSAITVQAQSNQEIEYQKNYEKRIKLTRINDVYIPVNTEEALKELMRLTEPEARAKLLTVPEDTIASKLHFSLGRWMLLNWGMEEGSRISEYYKSKGVSFNDDKIDLILRCFYRFLAAKDLKEEELIKHYIDKRNEELKLKHNKAKVVETIIPGKKHNE